MSILKAILHHYNSTSSDYDTLHPETESAQITDWHSGIMASLASTTLGTVVTAVTTDSVLGKLIKLLLDASGVKYLINTNGYVCFGSLFGGLIIQWGNGSSGYVTPPISYTMALQAIASWDDVTTNNHTAVTVGASLYETGKFQVIGVDGAGTSVGIRWILLCK